MRWVLGLSLTCTLLAVILSPTGVSGARILGVFPCPSKSHLVVFSALTRELARRGHELVVVSPFPLDKPVANYTDIDLMPQMKPLMDERMDEDLFAIVDFWLVMAPIIFWMEGPEITGLTLQNPQVKALLQDERGFDLVIVEDFMTEPLYAFAEYFKAPLILISSLGGLHSVNYAMGAPFEQAYMPNTMLPFTDRMSFLERAQNVLINALWDLGVQLFYLPRQEALRTQFFGESTRSVWDLRYTASLVLLNSHLSLNPVRPLVPAMLEVGGMQVHRQVTRLPADIQQFLDGASEGAIYFSMGSNLKSDAMPERMRTTLETVFSSLPQRVLMKWESDSLPGQPANVKLGKWLPQQDILAHPNVKVFVTHGGLLSAQEAAYHGVPLVGIPIFGDQMLNMRRAEQEGFGVMLEMRNVTETSLRWAIDKTLHDPRIVEESRRRSTVFRDQPQTPLERAVFWTEYVLRHKGAPQLGFAARHLTWYQRSSLDVMAALVALVSLVGIASCALVRHCCCSSAPAKHKSPTNKNNKPISHSRTKKSQ